jgi:hypothetical protein
MTIIKRFRRLTAVLAGLGFAMLASAAAASAATTTLTPPGGGGGGTGPAPVVQTVVVGGMPGWQIALITIGAALVAAIAAVLVDRARSARQRLVTSTA